MATAKPKAKPKPRKTRKHTHPENAGAQNLSEDYIEKQKDAEGTMESLYPIWKHGFKNREDYKGHWTEDALVTEVDAFFRFCFERSMKPSKATLCLWLDISKSQYHDWETKPEKYTFKSDLLKKASLLMEGAYIGRIEKYPTGNIFLLKTSHNHVETSKVEVDTKSSAVSKDEINETLEKMGLK